MRMIDSSGSRRISRTACSQATRRSASICFANGGAEAGHGQRPPRADVLAWPETGRLLLLERYTETVGATETRPPHTSTNWSRELRTASHRVAARRATEPVSRLTSCAVDADAIGRVTIVGQRLAACALGLCRAPSSPA